MNERIRELWRQAVLNNTKTPMNFQDAADEFAQLIIRECAAYIFVLDAEPVSHKSAAKMLLDHFGVES